MHLCVHEFGVICLATTVGELQQFVYANKTFLSQQKRHLGLSCVASTSMGVRGA